MSLKDPEREKRGVADRVIVKSPQSKVPQNLANFLKNGENKTRLIEIVKEELAANKETLLQKLQCRRIMFSMDQLCYEITTSGVAVVEQLSSNQEEADTKLLLHAAHSLSENADGSVVVRSPSGDVDINILFLSVFLQNPEKILIDYGRGDSRKILQLSSIDMSDEHKKALIGFHSFTGNDYVSSFFRKSKSHCWQVVEKNNRFVHMFSQLGAEWSIDEDQLSKLEEYVCNVFGKKKKDVNAVRYEIFKNVYERKGKIQDLSLLPPCRQSLQLHCQRSNYIAKVWRSCLQANIDFADTEQNGWSTDGKIVWIDAAFPEEIEQFFSGEESNDDSSDEGEDEEFSDSDEDFL